MTASDSFGPFSLPDEWADDDAMYSLMQPIKRPRHVDPDSYDRKVSFWSNLILKYAKDKRVLVVNIKAMKSVFTRYFPDEGLQLSPECLGETVEFLLRSGELECLQESTGRLFPIIKASLSYLVKAPISAAVRLVSG